MSHSIFVEYVLACTFPGCGGRQTIEQASSAGLVAGSLVPEDPTLPAFARCPRCRRYQMKVVEVPEAPKPQPPKGFYRVPEK